MEIAIIINGVLTVGNYKELFPNTSFSSNGPSDDWLTEHGAKKVTRFKEHNPVTQKLSQCEAYDDGEFVSVVEVVSLTSQEIEEKRNAFLSNIRGIRNNLLSDSDWTQIADAPLTDGEKLNWKTYRQALRDVTEQSDIYNIAWPLSPEQGIGVAVL